MRFLFVPVLLATVAWAFADLVGGNKPQEGSGGAVTRKLKGAFNPGPCVYNSDCGFEGKCKKWRCVWVGEKPDKPKGGKGKGSKGCFGCG
ncbi:unnamed protein product, partial [Mesorhabditis spiculigera]